MTLICFLIKKTKYTIVLIICIFCCIMIIKPNIRFTPFKSFRNMDRRQKLSIDYVEIILEDELKLILKCNDSPLKRETLRYGRYWLLKNYIRGRLSQDMECSESITYTTHGDYTFLGHLPTVVERWLAPISMALFAPGNDYNATMNSIQYLRNCVPESKLIRDYVSFHIFFPTKHMPPYIALNEAEALAWPYDCHWEYIPYEFVKRKDMYKTQQNLTYPINVGRNIARKAVNTYFIFACDIELYPSLGIVDQFLIMIVEDPSIILTGTRPKVFPMPVFEIDEHALMPNSKTELRQMLLTTMAIPFHSEICLNCHLVPQQYEWTWANDSEKMEVFTIGERYDDYVYWEPFYISDNKEPLFDERCTWEGQSNKRIQNYAMCLLKYEYHVLHPAFLVHSPGIKQFNNATENNIIRKKYVEAMADIIRDEIKPGYWKLYGFDTGCKV